MSDEPIIAARFAGKDSDEFFIQAARASCEMSIKNTGVGKWLGQSLDRLETAKAELLTAEQTGHKWFKSASDRRFKISVFRRRTSGCGSFSTRQRTRRTYGAISLICTTAVSAVSAKRASTPRML